MTPIAITFLIVSIVVVWGGLVASIVHLTRHPDDVQGDD
ncbi:methionine/alanine import family NSS transporter small subunit [Okibacterium endophyticum]